MVVIKNKAKTFNKNPTFAIWAMVIRPDEKTIALGGVPTGSIKAQLAAKVIGIQSCKMLYSECKAKDPITGINTVTKAKLDINSVPKIAMEIKTKSRR